MKFQKFFALFFILFFFHIQSHTPRVSIIACATSSNECIEQFLYNMAAQSLFSQSELILIDPTYSESKDRIIQPFLKAYTNIWYIQLPSNPGTCAMWNMGIKLACAPYITIEHISDRRAANSLENQLQLLERHHAIDLVYCNYHITHELNSAWYDMNDYPQSKLPNYIQHSVAPSTEIFQAVWQKNMHEKYGYFNGDMDEHYGQQEFLNRIIESGAKGIKSPFVSGLHYIIS